MITKERKAEIVRESFCANNHEYMKNQLIYQLICGECPEDVKSECEEGNLEFDSCAGPACAECPEFGGYCEF